jgi:hypothetical protein
VERLVDGVLGGVDRSQALNCGVFERGFYRERSGV